MSGGIYDVVVIGAGPAGLCAARSVLGGPSAPTVLLIDRFEPWKEPVACAEGVGRLGIGKILEPRREWIRLLVGKATFHSPDDTTITYTDPNKGYIINRSLMHRHLAEWCEEHGSVNRFGVAVKSVGPPGPDGVRSVVLVDGSIRGGRVVVDASGPLSRFGREEGVAWKPGDLEPALFAHVEGVELESDTVQMYVGRELAPGGYVWAFPRDAKSFNIGIVVGRAYRGKVNLRRLLEGFLEDRFGGLKVRAMHAGPIPCTSHRREPTVIPGFIKTGDAASTVNPISRAGIVEAMLSGTTAGETALAMLGTSTARELKRVCREHEKAWSRKKGRRHLKLAKVKGALGRIPDGDYNKAARSLRDIPHEQLTMSRIFASSLGRSPRLVWAMRHLM